MARAAQRATGKRMFDRLEQVDSAAPVCDKCANWKEFGRNLTHCKRTNDLSGRKGRLLLIDEGREKFEVVATLIEDLLGPSRPSLTRNNMVELFQHQRDEWKRHVDQQKLDGNAPGTRQWLVQNVPREEDIGSAS